MRRWLKEEQRWKEWQNLEASCLEAQRFLSAQVRWIQGHNPDLVVLENGNEKERAVQMAAFHVVLAA